MPTVKSSTLQPSRANETERLRSLFKRVMSPMTWMTWGICRGERWNRTIYPDGSFVWRMQHELMTCRMSIPTCIESLNWKRYEYRMGMRNVCRLVNQINHLNLERWTKVRYDLFKRTYPTQLLDPAGLTSGVNDLDCRRRCCQPHWLVCFH